MKSRAWLKMFFAAMAATWHIAPMTSSAQSPDTSAVVDSTAPGDAAEPPEPQPTSNLETDYYTFGEEDEEAWLESFFFPPPTEHYFSPGSVTGSIIAMPNLRIPATVNTVTADMIRDQQALSFSDVLRDISGAVQTNGGMGASSTDAFHIDQFALRGLDVTQFNFRKNGFLDPTYTPRDFANVERVEVLKGPASVLYGAAQPAGTVNLITKQAVADRFAWGGATLGSFDLQRYQFDVNSMNADGDLLVRINGAYQDNNSFRNFNYNERTFIAPTVTKLLGSNTAITWEGEYHEDRRMRDSGLIAVNGNSRAFSEEMFFGAPTDYASFRDIRSTLSLRHFFDNDWELYVGGTSLIYDAPSRGTVPQTGFTTTLSPQGFYTGAAGIGGNLNRSQNSASVVEEQNHGVIANLAGEVEGPVFTHKLLVGTEANWFIANHNEFSSSIAGLDPALTFNPTTGAQPFPGTTPINASFDFDSPGYYQNRFGVHVQDVVEVTDRLSLMGGVRWDTMQVKYDRTLLFGGFPIFTPTTSEETFDQLSPRAGVVYELVPESMSIYGLYTRSFAPPGRSVFADAPLQAEKGDMCEAGIKTQLTNSLLFTVSGFYIERENVAVQANNFNVGFTADQRSRGVEFDLVGQWSERFSTVTNYAYADVDQSGPTGFTSLNGRVRGIPFGTGNMWARYNLIQRENATLGIGLGYVHVGERRGDYNTPLRLSAYDRWDMALFGQYGRWDMTAYAENILDERYETGSISQYQVYPGAPVNFRMQVGVNF